jgi:RNA polymerase sigma factor (sigma-70 family)
MGLTKYYEEICERYPILTKEQEDAQLQVYFSKTATPAAKAKARDILICSNLRYVFKRAKKYSRGNVEQFEDLIAAGNEGLLAGLDKFDPQSGVRLLTYAGWWVMQRQLKEMSRWRLVALPAQKQQLATKIKKFVESKDAMPTLSELREEFPNASVKDLRELSKTQYITFYLDNMKDADMPIVNPIDQLVDELENDSLLKAIDALPYPDNQIVKLSYGIIDGVEMKPAEVVKALADPKYNQAYVKRSLSKSMELLRDTMEDGYGQTVTSGYEVPSNPLGYIENDLSW